MTSQTCLITGGAGQIAQALSNHPLAKRYSFVCLDKQTLDITDAKSIATQFDLHKPTLVINTAAYTKVDDAEMQHLLAHTINVEGAKTLAMACETHQIPLIHFSTDYVFDGQNQRLYDETDPTAPVSYYGQTKCDSEKVVREICEKHIILRVCGVFSATGQNFVKSILRAAKTRDRLQVVSDQITCPTAANDIAGASWRIVDFILKNTGAINWGTYHFSSANPISWYHFAEKLCEYAHKQGIIKHIPIDPIDTTTLARPAKRPAYAVFNCDKIKKTFDITQPDWQKSLGEFLICLLSLKKCWLPVVPDLSVVILF
jgi:dTDP-4-dehydrorhamnose reductase